MTKKTGISVPEGYFSKLETRLQSIPSQEVNKPTVIQKVSPWLAYAASLAILAALGNFIFGRAAATEDDAWDYYSYLSQSLDPDGQIELMESPTLTEEDDIRSFLIASNIPVEHLEELEYEEDY
jgi:hypothetical protein